MGEYTDYLRSQMKKKGGKSKSKGKGKGKPKGKGRTRFTRRNRV